MTIYFTSDIHFGHENIIRFTNRPFADTSEMDRTLLCNINARVRKDDTLYVLGDFAMGRGIDKQAYARELLKKMECENVVLVLGNHDPQDKSTMKALGFSEVYDYHEISYEGRKFCLMHYPLLEWNGFYRGSYDLHGHVHNDLSYNEEMKREGIRRFDVGVDANNYFPVSIDEIIAFFER